VIPVAADPVRLTPNIAPIHLPPATMGLIGVEDHIRGNIESTVGVEAEMIANRGNAITRRNLIARMAVLTTTGEDGGSTRKDRASHTKNGVVEIERSLRKKERKKIGGKADRTTAHRHRPMKVSEEVLLQERKLG